MNAIIDTNILIDSHAGVDAAAAELERYDELSVSRVTWIEFFTGSRNPKMEHERQLIIGNFELLEISPEVAKEAVLIRQTSRLKLPDAIILATARVHGLLLVTRNSKDFSRREPEVRIPY